jgi:hypothetical protein
VRPTPTGDCGTDFALASGKIGPTREILGLEQESRVVPQGVFEDETGG